MKMTPTKFIILIIMGTVVSDPTFARALDSAPPAQGAFDEGTRTHISPSEIASIKAWVETSKVKLMDLLESARSVSSYQDAKALLIQGIRDTVLISAPKTTELMMRYTLNRGLKVISHIDKVTKSSDVGVLDQEVRVLKQSISFALNYYQDDLNYLVHRRKSRHVQIFATVGCWSQGS